MLITINPIKPKPLASHFQACDIVNLSSWQSIHGEIKQITGFKTFESNPTEYLELIYENPKDNPYFFCKTYIPQKILYKALKINLRYKINQPAKIEIGLHRVGQGPAWKPISIEEESIDKVITSTWLIDENLSREPKLNWLSGPYERITFAVTEFDRAKPLILIVYEVYLE